jgi:hypothetical protein
VLDKGDKIKDLDRFQMLDLRDYINMRSQISLATVKFNSIKSMIITEQGMTLWQFTEKYLDTLENRPIGQIEAPVGLFEWILQRVC